MNKDKYIEIVDSKFDGKSKDILLRQIELYYLDVGKLPKTKYKLNDLVFLKKGTFIHGIFGELDGFDYVMNNGFVSVDFTDETRANKIKNSVGMWNIQNDILLRDYVLQYSGFTIVYSVGRGPGSKQVSELIPYHKFDEYTEKINNDERIWNYWGDKTKEVSFIPSLVSNKRQIAFILNMESEYAKQMSWADVWNTEFDQETLRPFLDYRYYNIFLDERFNRSAITTDRESSIMFGLPVSLIEGVLVGRKIERDKDALNYIKKKLPDCYICNLDGLVIIDNK